jgi:hypothetical protein
MPAYQISYDLHAEGRHDYQRLYDALDAAKAVAITESTWCLATAWDAAKLGAYLRKFMHSDDVLAVDELAPGRGHTSYGLSGDALAWRERHLASRLPVPPTLKSRLPRRP